ncbi:MFS transporter [Actinocatenispora rupis]|uniref:MFS transporter n=1 Tax=Actinocatenispora rupis TaxID=519421 RepID=A0A8J3JDA7_9ACTN|nr:MFS transporter [Actinocatenispora rupis]GID14634.1 MFS transporter [Actinocatenispora rupis]
MFSTFSGLPRTAWIIFAGTVVNRLGYVVTPFLVFYLGARGVPAEQTPYVLGALGAGNLLGPAVGGLLADRFGRRPTMLAGLVGTAAAQGLLYAAPNVVTLALAAALLSCAGTTVGPAAGALLADTVAPGAQRAAFSLIHWAINIGTAVAGVLGGFLATQGYWLLFAVDAATCLTFAVVVGTLLPAGRARPRSGTGGAGYGVVLRDRLMRALLPLFVVGLTIYSLTEVCLPLAIRDDGLSTTTYGLLAALNAVLVVVAQPFAARILARFRQVPVQVLSSVVIAVGVAATGLAHRPWEYAGTVVVWSLGEAMAGGIAASIVAGLAPADARGRYQGSFQWSIGVGRFVALGAATAVYATVGPAAIWLFSLVAGTASALGVAVLGPAIARRTAEVVSAQDAAPANVAAGADQDRPVAGATA